MRTTLTLFLAAGVALTVALELMENYDPNECVMVPYPNYTMYSVKISDLESIKKRSGTNFLVNFYLFTKNNAKNPQKIATGNVTTLNKSHFNPMNPTRFLIHGWRQKNQHLKSPFTNIRDKYMNVGSFNIFIVDWSEGNSISYIKSAYQTIPAGKKVGAFIEFLITKGKLKANDTYIVGFSLGAHVAGIAGKSVTSQKINTIIGLDPARPLFIYATNSTRLTTGDARYVETIHTNAGYLGLNGPTGHASFYPNYGSRQPGCSYFQSLTGCSHSQAVVYFAESITNPAKFKAVKCSSYSDIAKLKCNANGAKITLRMGGEPSNFRNYHPGVYYLRIDARTSLLYSNYGASALQSKSSLSLLKIKPGSGYVIMIK